MISEIFQRTRLLYGDEGMERLRASRVAVFGVGGVGGYTVEALVRSGVGALDLIDSDTVSATNLNRQIIATRGTIGQYKVDAAKARALSVNPEICVDAIRMFFLPENRDEIDFTRYDYVVDAVDTVAAKLTIIECAVRAGVRVISAMGAGNKTRPAMLEVADIYDTSVCPLARVMRRECRKRGIGHLKVVYSREEPLTPLPADGETAPGRRAVPGSTAFVPAAAGLIIAGEVVNELCGGPAAR